jgi:hypothetical protein
MADELYIVQNDIVFPVNLDAHESTYSSMPFAKFLAKVKAAIAGNINTNLNSAPFVFGTLLDGPAQLGYRTARSMIRCTIVTSLLQPA